jgi:anti-sigma factor (TIGR02949 family)
VDCKEFQGRVSAAVDNCLKKEEMDAMFDHAGACMECRYEYEIERATKSIVKSRALRVRAPEGLLRQITDQLEEISKANIVVPRRFTLGTRSFLKPSIAFVVACVAVIILLNLQEKNTVQPSGESSQTHDVMVQSFANYKGVVDGVIRPQLAASVPEQLMGFFTGKTEFPVLVPRMKNCTLVGGVVNEHCGAKLAHVVYTHNDDVIYVYQACWETVMKGEQLSLPDSIIQELQRTGWHSENFSGGHAIVLWTKGHTLCSAVARMPKEDLIACLTDNESW